MIHQRLKDVAHSTCLVGQLKLQKRLDNKHTLLLNTPLAILNSGKTTEVANQIRPVTTQISNQSNPGTVRKGPPWRILFLGTDEFALHHLTALNENRHLTSGERVVDSLEVVLPKTDRYCAVKSYLQRSPLVIHQWPLKSLAALTGKFDIGVVTSFGHLIPERVINLCPYGILNVHPSLLPRWRGAAPISHTILNNDKHTGISIMKIQPKRFDVGPVLLQEMYPVPDDCRTPELTDFLGQEGARLLLQVLSKLHLVNENEYIPQMNTAVTYAHKLKVVHSQVDWIKQTVSSIDCQYRALSNKLPLRTRWLQSTVKLQNMISPTQKTVMNVDLGPDDSLSGRPHYDKMSDILWIRCKDDWVGFKNIVMKKPMTAKDFYNGYLSKGRNQNQVFESLNNDLHI